MRVSHIHVEREGDCCQLQAQVLSDSDRVDSFAIWYRFPAWCGELLNPDNGDPFLAALLPLAMWTGEPLEIAAPVSPKLLRAIPQIQSIYTCFDKELARIEVHAPLRPAPLANDRDGGDRALFFSMGVDSFYSLLKNVRDHPRDKETITHLLSVHGFDLDHARQGAEFSPITFDHLSSVAQALNKTLVPVATNVKTISEPLVSWGMYHGAALASIALSLGDMFRQVHIAASTSYDQLYPWGSHPVLDPLWSTERLAIVHDGCEFGRIDKTRMIAQSQIALDTLRVCFGYGPEYNCGRCAKCLPTMIDLMLAGALYRCRTLPHSIDSGAMRRIFRAYGDELNYENYRERFEALEGLDAHADLRAVIAEYLAKRTGTQLEASTPLSGADTPAPQGMLPRGAWLRRCVARVLARLPMAG